MTKMQLYKTIKSVFGKFLKMDFYVRLVLHLLHFNFITGRFTTFPLPIKIHVATPKFPNKANNNTLYRKSYLGSEIKNKPKKN